MTMPKATVNEYDFFPSRENEIGLSWQLMLVQAISIPQGKKEIPNPAFRLGIARPDQPHPIASFLLGEDVGHFIKPAKIVNPGD